MNRTLIIILLVAALALAWWRMQPGDETVRRTQLLMGTVVEIVASGEHAPDAVDDAFAEMARRILSTHGMLLRLTTKVAALGGDSSLSGEVALCKVQSSKTLEFCAREASQILGGKSYLRDGKLLWSVCLLEFFGVS